MNKVTLVCKGIPANAGKEASEDIVKEFHLHRSWHASVKCTWDGKLLTLVSINDFDNDGKATLDEFSDSLAAYVANYFDFNLSIESVEKL